MHHAKGVNTRVSEPTPRKRGRPSTAEGRGNPVDVHVGKRIKTRRLVRGWTQDELAHAVDLSFQQVQKYERGSNRVSAGRLYELSKALDVPIQYFFDDYVDEREGDDPNSVKEDSIDFEGVDRIGDAVMSELVRGFSRIESKSIRQALVQLTLSVAKTHDDKTDDLAL